MEGILADLRDNADIEINFSDETAMEVEAPADTADTVSAEEASETPDVEAAEASDTAPTEAVTE